MNTQTNHGQLSDAAHVGHLLANVAQTSCTRFMCRSLVKIASHEPLEIPLSSAISRTVNLLLLRATVLTLAIISSFLNVDSRPEQGSLSTEVLPSLNRQNQSNTCVWPIASSPYACCNNWYVSVVVFPMLKHNLMQMHCLVLSHIVKIAMTYFRDLLQPTEQMQPFATCIMSC